MNIVNFEDIEKELLIARNKFNELSQKQGEADKLQDEILHQLENNNFNACQGYQYSKALHDLRIRRRKIKQDLSEQQIILNMLEPFIKSYNKNRKSVVDKEIKGHKDYKQNIGSINNKLKTL